MKKILCLSVLALFVSGCQGGQWKTTTTVGGKTTVSGDEKTMKQENAKQEYEANNLEKLKNSEKRTADEPITVAFFRPIVADNLKKTMNESMMFDLLIKEFKKDPIIRLVDQSVVDQAQQAQSKNGSSSDKNKSQVVADISVFTNIMAEEQVGLSQSSGKVVKMAALVLKAKIISHYLPEDQYKLEESGNIFANTKVVKDYVNKVCELIKTKPHIPSAAYKKQAETEKKEQFEDALKNLFKKKE